MDLKNYGQQEPVPHLFPEKLYQCTTPVTAQAKQANKHDEKQGNVSNEAGCDIGYSALAFENHTGHLGRGRCRAKLGLGLGHDFKYWN